MGKEVKKHTLARPFATTRQAVGFAFLVLFFLLLPLVLAVFEVPSREEVYAGSRHTIDLFHYRELFEKKTDVDIAVIGLSTLWVGLDSSYLEDQLGMKLGRKAAVFTMGANNVGEDLVYLLVKDLLEHRRVKMVILAPPPRRQQNPHPDIHRVLQYGIHKDSWEGLPLLEKARFYALCVLGAPRQALGAIRPDIMRGIKPELALANGTWIRSVGWQGIKDNHFTEKKVAPILADPREFIHYGGRDEGDISFTNEMSPYQEYFFRKTIDLLRSNGVKVALLYLPLYNDRTNKTIPIRASHDATLGSGLPIVGLAPAKFFRGMSDEEIQYLYYNINHFNTNGTEYFSKTFTPAIMEVYSNEVRQ